MSNSARPHRRQPTRPRRPWDSPGKNTGVGCHFLLQCMKVKSESEVAQSCLTLSDPMDCSPPGSSVHGRRSIFISSVHFLGKSTGVGCHCLLPGFPIHHQLLELTQTRHRCHPTISSSVISFSSGLQSLPASGSFPMSQFFTSGGQSIGVSASASVLPMNIQDWFSLGWTE